MKIPLLADKGLEIARAYGVLKVGGKGNKISSFFGKSDFPRSCLLGICVPFPWEIDANICPTQQNRTNSAGRQNSTNWLPAPKKSADLPRSLRCILCTCKSL